MLPEVNNDYYNDLHMKWYQAEDDPIAVLRAEQKIKNPWVIKKIQDHFGEIKNLHVCDIGCGAGFLTNYLVQSIDHVCGIDQSLSSLKVAESMDSTHKVQYKNASAYELPFEANSMNVVSAMDFLEHVDRPSQVVKEASRVLKDNGLFMFHTFNRNWLSYLVVIKFMEWFVPNTPKHLHVLHLFIKPQELEQMMITHQLTAVEWVGIRPKFNLAFWKSLFARKVHPQFEFCFTRSLVMGYMGVAVKKRP